MTDRRVRQCWVKPWISRRNDKGLLHLMHSEFPNEDQKEFSRFCAVFTINNFDANYLNSANKKNLMYKMNCHTEEDSSCLEEHLILRLPLEEANKLHMILNKKPEKVKKLLKIDIEPSIDKVFVHFCDKILYGNLKKFPTIIESYKTNISNNKSLLFKTADISHIIECSYDDYVKEKERLHGYCPPLKNVKMGRFRKTMYNEDTAIETEMVSKELYYLLSTDLDAVSTRFELIKDSTQTVQDEEHLFGEFSSTSSFEELDVSE